MKTALERIADERAEQITKHRRTLQFDLTHNAHDQLTMAADNIVKERTLQLGVMAGWDVIFFRKVFTKPRDEQLVIAGALYRAEQDRYRHLLSELPKGAMSPYPGIIELLETTIDRIASQIDQLTANPQSK